MSLTSPLARQMKARDKDMVPRILVQGMFALMLASLALVSYARITDMPRTGLPTLDKIVTERSVTFEGDRNFGIQVLDANGTEIANSTRNKAGFIDVVWVAMMRERKVQRADPAAPFRIVRRENGRIDILDDTTGWALELIGYGPDNIAAFASLLD
ncbi:photosynthetic complex assembly protein PuhC [uncultured Sulfitobacter sp.]|uniref:photosynthetic complex assembly protein PuhC n=1 Tax=uncultured Sulfitobacter sp. TaxID=191468 RepID=UPI0026139DD3|nr:photosynthetic complex assembly protein PuhC [uncultured Sulfitobacter sp.]